MSVCKYVAITESFFKLADNNKKTNTDTIWLVTMGYTQCLMLYMYIVVYVLIYDNSTVHIYV